MTTVIKWELRCLTDDKLEYWYLTEDDGIPSTCPTNSSHTIDSNSIVIDSTISQDVVTVKEEYTPTGGKWEAEAFFIQGSTGPSSTPQDFVWDNPVSVLNMQFYPESSNRYDQLTLEVIPPDTGYGEGVIGTLTATAVTGATGIEVTQTIIDNVKIADNLSLQQGAQVQELGNILSIDKENRIVYCKNPVQYNFDVSGPSLVKYKRYVLENFVLGPPQRYPLGDSKIGGSYVPTGYIVRVTYINKGTEEKELYCIIEYLE